MIARIDHELDYKLHPVTYYVLAVQPSQRDIVNQSQIIECFILLVFLTLKTF